MMNDTPMYLEPTDLAFLGTRGLTDQRYGTCTAKQASPLAH